MIAHLLGWFGKAILLRDFYLCWFLSIMFEVLELSLQHLLPNFAECWWDHVSRCRSSHSDYHRRLCLQRVGYLLGTESVSTLEHEGNYNHSV